jgi:PPOX class probable F420-dependent enzyme
MAVVLSDKAQTFLKEEHFAVLSTINKNGSSLLTPMWYVFDDDGTIIMNSQVRLQKVKNIRRDPRITVCVEDGTGYVSINGTVELIEDQEVIRRDIELMVKHYIKDETTWQQSIAAFASQPRVALHLKGEKSKEMFF